MEIDELVEKYKNENNNLIEYIQELVNNRHESGDWDIGIEGKSKNLVTMLLYEYSTSIQKLTEGKISPNQVVDKIATKMGKLRIGDFQLGTDDNVAYDGYLVTSDEYKKKCRIESKFGAHAIDYENENGESKTAVVFLDNNQLATIDSKEYKLSGIDLQDLADIRHTAFHEWTHVMEKCEIKTSELTKEDVIYKYGKSIYINSALSPGLEIQNYKDYVTNIDNLLDSDTKIPFAGITTIELNDKKKTNKRIMHNQVSEGATEFIAREVMKTIDEEVKHPDRYNEQVKIIGDIFKSSGLADTLTMYFTQPHKIIKMLENKKVNNKDMLHYISNYIKSSHISKLFVKCEIDEDGNIETGGISKLVSKVRGIFFQKNHIALLQNKTNVDNVENIEQNNFIKSMRVSDEEIIENVTSQAHGTETQTKSRNNEELSINE